MDYKRRSYDLIFVVKAAVVSLLVFLPGFFQFFIYGRFICLIVSLLLTVALHSFIVVFEMKLKIFLPLVIIATLIIFVMILLGRMPGAFDYISLINTNFNEVFAFILDNIIVFVLYIGIFTVVIGLVLFFFHKLSTIEAKNPSIAFKKKFFAIPLFLSLLPFFIVDTREILSSYPFALLSDTIVNWNFFRKAPAYRNLKYTFDGDILDGKTDINFILIIGESARKSCFGFTQKHDESSHSTSFSPRMDEITKLFPNRCIIQKNYISNSHSTVPTVLTMLNPSCYLGIFNCFEKPNLLLLLRSSGFHVILLRSQTCGYVDEYMGVADEILDFLGNRDTDMLPKIEGILDSPGRLFIVVHTKGSHFSSLNVQGGSYEDSIHLTDDFLSALFNTIQRSPKASCAWFVSDHGENLNSLHGSGNITYWEIEVPSLIFANDAFIKFADKRWENVKSTKETLISHYNLSHTIMGLTQVFPKNYYLSQKDASSINYSEDKDPILIPNNMIPITYSACKFKEE